MESALQQKGRSSGSFRRSVFDTVATHAGTLTVTSLGIGRPVCRCSCRLTIGASSFRPVGLAGAIVPTLPHSRTVHSHVLGLGADIVPLASLRPFSPKTSWLGTPTIAFVPKLTHILERMCGGQNCCKGFPPRRISGMETWVLVFRIDILHSMFCSSRAKRRKIL